MPREPVTDRLEAAVSAMLETDHAEIVEAVRTPLDYDPYQAGRSITRIAGSATTGGGRRAWSMIEKVTGNPDSAPPFIREGGRRELLAYRSGLLDCLPAGFAAPRDFGLHEDPDGRVVLFLEEVVDERAGSWERQDWIRAATHLGRFSARWLAEPVASAPWMLQRWSERHGQPAAMAAASSAIAEQAALPQVISRFGPGLADTAVSLLAMQAELRAALDRAPHTLCHHDAVRANLFARMGEGTLETVAIDWETLGIGPVGAEIASLLFSSSRRGDLSAAELQRMLPAVLDAYADAIAAAGFADAAAGAETSFWQSVALRWSLLRDVLASLASPAGQVSRGRALHEPPETALDELAALTHFLLVAYGRAKETLGNPAPAA